MITTSEIKISVLVDRDSALPALRAVHQAFELEQEPRAVPPEHLPAQPTATAAGNGPDLGNLVQRLQGIDMEELFISDLSLDQEPGAGHHRRRPQPTGRRRRRLSEHRRRGHLRGHDRAEPQRLQRPHQPELHGARRTACPEPWRSPNNWPANSAATRSPIDRKSPSSRCPGSGCAATPASPSACSAPWRTPRSTST